MYMNTRANLDYWSTDNCCLRWSLKTGAITIGVLSLIWQSLMVMSGVMMLVRCPVPIDTNTTLAEDLDLTPLNASEEIVLSGRNFDARAIGDGGKEDAKCLMEVEGIAASNNSSLSSGNSSISSESNSSKVFEGSERKRNFTCPWLPDPETEVLGVYSEEKLILVASIFIAYSGIYSILSLCVVIGCLTNSVSLLQGWVALTGFHNILILASLLVPLPFTTLPHLFLSIAHFILSLYTWAVVKSYMHSLKVELSKPLLPEGSITDYTVDGVDVTEIPVQV